MAEVLQKVLKQPNKSYILAAETMVKKILGPDALADFDYNSTQAIYTDADPNEDESLLNSTVYVTFKKRGTTQKTRVDENTTRVNFDSIQVNFESTTGYDRIELYIVENQKLRTREIYRMDKAVPRAKK